MKNNKLLDCFRTITLWEAISPIKNIVKIQIDDRNIVDWIGKEAWRECNYHIHSDCVLLDILTKANTFCDEDLCQYEFWLDDKVTLSDDYLTINHPRGKIKLKLFVGKVYQFD